MPFKIKLSNEHGSFSFKTDKEVDSDFIEGICNIATTALNYNIEEVKTNKFYGPELVGTPNDLIQYTQSNGNQQTQLGEKPVQKITYGEFVPPEKGLTLKILNILPPGKERIDAIRAFREITKISILGSKEILCGNYPSPLFTPEMGKRVLEDFKNRGIFARLLDLSVVAV